MTIPIHYVPILIWKRAEQNALANLTDEQKDYIIPLLQLVMTKPPVDKEKKRRRPIEEAFDNLILEFKNKRIPKIPEEIKTSWGQRQVYIDFSLLYTIQLKIESISRILDLGSTLSLNLIPVLNLSDSDEIKKAACSSTDKFKGVCIRAVSSDLKSIKNLNEKLSIFIQSFGLNESSVDILVDIKEKETEYYRLSNISQQIISLLKWRRFIFACGSFPEDLSKCKLDDTNSIPRSDWLSWSSCFKKGNIKRIPTFADYTIRHPIYNESLQFFAPTTSIKYTCKNDWLIMKGRKQKFELYLANAKILLNSPDVFYGEYFSFGDKYIAEKGRHYDKYIKDRKIKGTGSTESWLTASINHHIACIISQLANLPERKGIR